MEMNYREIIAKFVILGIAILLSTNVWATTEANLKQEVGTLKREVTILNKKVAALSASQQQPRQRDSNPKSTINQYNNINIPPPRGMIQAQPDNPGTSLYSQWTQTTSVAHLSGYADAGYVDHETQHGNFFLGHFNPIFHYLYRDLILGEGELELEVNGQGQTETKLEYADLGLFLNNYMTFIIGKFLSPLGYFRQNLHPTWINRLPSNPPGFGKDQAAPEADIGAELRGGFSIGGPVKVTYAVYVSNGPKAEVEDDVIQKIETEGFNVDIDGNMVVGGRVGIQPVPKLVIGVSGATGKVGLFDEGTGALTENRRHYYVYGVDASLIFRDLRLRGEIIEQRIDSRNDRTIPGGRWLGWYGQAAYRFSPSKLEAILRYGEYKTFRANQNLEQWAFGFDYWFAANVVAKIAYELNCGQPGTSNNADTFLFQLAYGF